MRKEIPILFSTPMVRQIIAGNKTMTRRKVGNFPYHEDYSRAKIIYDAMVVKEDSDDLEEKLLKGACVEFDEGEWIIKSRWNVGDLLWVRETWSEWVSGSSSYKVVPIYKASEDIDGIKWKPSIHLKKKWARIWLEITEVRVERLQQISDKDSRAEGITGRSGFFEGQTGSQNGFQLLWESINGKESWEENPFVWAISFKVLSTTGKP